MTTTTTAPAGYGTLQRGLGLLTLLAHEGRLRVADLAERSGLPLSTAYRYVAVLRDAGFVVDLDGYVMAGPLLAEQDDGGTHLVDLARPVLRRAATQTGCTAVLTVRVRTAALCLDVALGSPRHRVAYRRGQAGALHAGASALPLLAHAPPSVQREVLAGPQRRFTAATPDAAAVRTQLEDVLRQGWVLTRGQLSPGMTAVGVPVVVGGRCLCALSLVGGSGSMPDPAELVRVLTDGAAELAARLPAHDVWEDEDA